MALIEVRNVHKSYGAREVLRGIDLDITDGEVVGILGPNGAGKTTLVEAIGGLRTPDSGSISVADIDPTREDARLRQLVGMQLQQCRLPAKITPAEALDLFGSFYPEPRATEELLERFGLSDQRGQHFEKLSGGQQQRLSVALALIGRPRIAILDELTTGLDPAARREIWSYLDGLTAEGTTILLVTHSMEEAEYLCDRVAILDGGRIVAEGTPAEISGTGAAQVITFVPSATLDHEVLSGLPGITGVSLDNGRFTVTGDAAAPQTVLAALSGRAIRAEQLRIVTPSLDEAYLRATALALENPADASKEN
ncbi:ABC transporter ATP-binding protein [Ammonicoccus fulvus]|uniref:ABC transporter ATP-binding protein n=1 Tax=Ammonicoccus fulvus TaxID=3138240 RepID=A0ABZ3FIU4_9ACTN